MARKAKELRLTQLEEFLSKVDACGEKFSQRQKIELGKHFLEVVMGLRGEFIACKQSKESPDFEPHNEELYPWALFVTDKDDLQEDYHDRAQLYLHGDNAGKKNYVVVTNGKEMCVFDFNHEIAKYTVLFDKLISGNTKAIKHWQVFLSDFGVESAEKKKKERKKERRLKIYPQQNYVICGDCIDWLEDIPPASVDMCYIDPPFFSNRNYEIIWGNGYERRSFEDRWKGGIHAYIEWMEKRVKLIHRCLKETGSIFLHCDYRASHKLRGMLDDEFGKSNFRNEIVWCYTGPSNSKNFFPRKHDTILYYSKSKESFFKKNAVRIPYSDSFIHRRSYTEGKKGITAGYSEGRNSEEITESFGEGKIIEDWWSDIPSGGQISRKERLGYKTQKPEKILERIISCSTNANDLVLDCFAGGGTTAAVAAKLNRRFIVGDVSPVAVRVISDRLSKITDAPEFDLLNVPLTKTEWLEMDGHTFAAKICEFMGWECNPKKSDDGGIDGWANKGSIPVQIKNHRQSIGVNPIKNFYASLGKAAQGIFVAWSFAPKAEEYRAKVKKDECKEIIFKPVTEILGSILIDDDEKIKLDELSKKYDKAA